MEGKQLRCAVCRGSLNTAEAETLVSTDAGPVHAECFEGPVPPGSEVELDELEIAAENERRRDHGEPPIDETRMAGISIVEGRVCADERSARKVAQEIKSDLERPLDPERL